MAHILLVDDDPEVSARYARAIEGAGHSVSRADSPAAALEALKARPPDLVVLEAIFAGKFTGVTLARRLAEIDPDLPLIMMTRADERLTTEQLDLEDRDGGWIPVDRYLAKPVMRDVLTAEIQRLLDEAGGPAAEESSPQESA